jgi:hypothetical protein
MGFSGLTIYWDYGNIFGNGRMYIGSIGFDTLWHYYVYQIDALEGIKQVYMDGNLLKSESNSSTLGNRDRSLWIGGGTDANPGNIRFHGRIDELRIYNRTLDSEEVSWLYNASECIEYHVVYDTIPVYDTVPVYDTTFIVVHDTVPVFVNVPVFDTIPVFDTVSVTIYDSISVGDTLVFEAVFTGLDSEQHTSLMKVYPNPARTMIYIDTGEEFEQLAGHSIVITNAAGAIVYITGIQEHLIEIDVRELGYTGLYILHVIDPDTGIIARKKIVLQ